MSVTTVQITPYTNDFADLPRTTHLLRESGLRAFLLHLKPTEEMPEHKVAGPITVHCLQGSVLFSTAEESVELETGSILSLPGSVPHRLIAREGSLMLVTVAG